jgi:hypothetical protein
MGNALGHWNNWGKNEKGKFERREHKNHSCGSCGHHDQSACDCNFKAVRRVASPLNSDCIVVNSVVGSKMVQKVAEFTFPFTAFGALLVAGATIVSVTVVPNTAAIVHNVRVIKDKVVNIGFIPATVTVNALGPTGLPIVPLTLTTRLPFQEHTDFPGACPEDTVVEPPLVVEGIFAQPGVPVIGTTGLISANAILVKIVLRTTITVTRQVIVDSHGGICDVNERRCETTTTPTTNTLPAP